MKFKSACTGVILFILFFVSSVHAFGPDNSLK